MRLEAKNEENSDILRIPKKYHYIALLIVILQRGHPQSLPVYKNNFSFTYSNNEHLRCQHPF